MNIELIKKWVEALESGNYTQTKHKLQDNYGYCCLGVLAEVAGATKTPDEDSKDGGFVFKFPDTDEPAETAGCPLRWWCKNFPDLQCQSFYYTLNDTKNKTFSEIAAQIRLEAKL